MLFYFFPPPYWGGEGGGASIDPDFPHIPVIQEAMPT